MSGRVVVARRSMWVGPDQFPIISEGDRTLCTIHDDVHIIATRILRVSFTKSGAAKHASSVMTVYMSDADEDHQQISVLFCSDRSRETKPTSRERRISISEHIRGLETNENYGNGPRRNQKPRMTMMARAKSKLQPVQLSVQIKWMSLVTGVA